LEGNGRGKEIDPEKEQESVEERSFHWEGQV
jgi:hypothetical protein